MTDTYQALAQRFAEIAHLNAITQLLNWDARTMMPADGAASRAEQLSTLERQKHRLYSDPQLAELLAGSEQASEQLNPWQQANLRAMRHDYSHATALDESLSAALSKAYAEASHVWLQARDNNDYSLFAPVLGTVTGLQQQVAQAKAEVIGGESFDALLDFCEPGMTMAMINPLFAELEDFLPGFVREVQDRQQTQSEPLPLSATISLDELKAMTRQLAQHLGYDFAGARLDHTGHPFAMVEVAGDARITAHYDEQDPLSTLRSVFHEVGHALYERNLPEQWRYQPVGRARGFATHESQSLALDMIACRSKAFLQFLAVYVHEHCQVSDPAWGADNLIRLVQRVAPGLIRIKADEVTYPLHVILRYRLEQALLDGSLPVADLPAAWNDGMETLLGIRPTTDAEGCLQDMHWAVGYWGYFPSYTLGVLKAAQLFAAARQTMPDIMEQFGRGDVSSWLAWLDDKIHKKASFLSGEALMRDATGEKLNTRFYKHYLQERYVV